MASVVSMDRAGRILLPATARKQMGFRPGSKFLIAELEDGRLVLIPLDVEELAKRIRQEMKGVDIDAEVAKVKRDLRKLAEKEYPELAKRLKKRG
jgi:AbrB family looped-hinge helix DNA binding protein